MAKLAAPLCGRVCRVGDFTGTSLSGAVYPTDLRFDNCEINANRVNFDLDYGICHDFQKVVRPLSGSETGLNGFAEARVV